MSKRLTIADLFCGAGGTSTGAIEAAREMGFTPKLTAVNHWPVAIETHQRNHPNSRHVCNGVDDVNPRELFREGELDILWASPECTHHSVARGGRPIHDQSRATAWCVVRWAEALRPRVILVENVPEFQSWGPIGSNGRPLKSRKGEVFQCWLNTLRALGYRVDYRILQASDYGDATSRRRLFIQAVRGQRKVAWPEPTHGPSNIQSELFARQPWRGAREIIDWSIKGQSVFRRKRPLAPKTMQRIFNGLRKYGLRPLIVQPGHANKGNDDSEHRVTDVSNPLGTIPCSNRFGLAEPYIVAWDHQSGKGEWPIDAPLSTVTTKARHGVVEPHLLPQQSDGVLRPVSEPCPTIACAGAIGLVEPYIVSYYGNGQAHSMAEPLDTVTTKDRFGLAVPVIVPELATLPVVEFNGRRFYLDILFRMLQPQELAAAQGFPKEYRFVGTKTDITKQIGNAVPCGLARALVRAVLGKGGRS